MKMNTTLVEYLLAKALHQLLLLFLHLKVEAIKALITTCI